MSATLKTSIWAGLIAGTVDLGAACLINAIAPGPVLRFIATGLLGTPIPREPWVYCLGLTLQWVMSIIIAAVFVLAANRTSILLRRPIWTGVGYGIVVYVVMTFVVVPLSRAQAGHPSVASGVENLLAMIVFGLIIVYVTRHRLQRRVLPRQSR